MNKKLFNVLLFTTGAAVGSLVTWKVLKTRYERIAQEEIDSVKETWARMNDEKTNDEAVCKDETDDAEQEETDDEDVDEEEFDESTMIDYSQIASRYKTSGEKAENDGEGEGDDNDLGFPYINGPYVITPGDFGDGNFDHDLHCLTYYSDGVLANDWWEVLNIEETIGQESLEHFGEHAEDILHVRNERAKADYEVVRDYRNYSDVIANDPLMRTYED